jgi:hypothetical protein
MPEDDLHESFERFHKLAATAAAFNMTLSMALFAGGLQFYSIIDSPADPTKGRIAMVLFSAAMAILFNMVVLLIREGWALADLKERTDFFGAPPKKHPNLPLFTLRRRDDQESEPVHRR